LKTYENKITKYLDSVETKKEKSQSEKGTTSNGKKRTKKKVKKNALVMCRDGAQFWTTQKQFWQWVRENVVEKVGDNPLKGKFTEADSEKDIILANQILNISRPRHLSEVMEQRKYRKQKKN
jgi:hypothetical protein